MTLTLYTLTLQNTVAQMYRMVQKHWSEVRTLNLPTFADAFDFVKQLPYKEDGLSPECDFSGECIKAPMRTIEYGGDCDDKAVLLGSFAMLFGIPFRFVTTSYQSDPGQQVHTYIEIQVEGHWYPADATYNGNMLFSEKPFASKQVWNPPTM